MTRTALRKWLWVHTWSSVACTVFLLLICVTGLPLVFHEEIDHWLDDDPPYAALPADAPRASLDVMAAASRQLHPDEIIVSMFVDDDEPQVVVSMARSWDALKADPKAGHWIKFDARTAQVLARSKPRPEQRQSFTDVMLRLHTDLFAGLSGELFMGAMALLFVAAIVSGAVLYAPFMRKREFGTVRSGGSQRLKWLDLHNLLGAITLVWALVVGATGLLNELSKPLFAIWQRTDVRALTEPWRGRPAPPAAALASVQDAFDTARGARPGMTVISVLYPGGDFGSPHHYMPWTKGTTPLTARLFSPVLVDASSGRLAGVVTMPWYLRALQISRPLHFGDYGGLPLKIIWALLDLVTIAVLCSGLYLWFARRSSSVASAPVKHGHDDGRSPFRPREAAE
jgi:uncharacterized iron-regulated membrane protein